MYVMQVYQKILLLLTKPSFTTMSHTKEKEDPQKYYSMKKKPDFCFVAEMLTYMYIRVKAIK